MSTARPAPGDPSLRRRRLVELDPDACWANLRSAIVGRVVRVVEDRPTVAVVNIGVEGTSVVLRSRRGGRLAATLAHPGVAALVEADGLDPATRTGWSVVAHGLLVPVLDEVESAHLHRTQPASWLLGDHDGVWLRLEVDDLVGRELVDDEPSTR